MNRVDAVAVVRAHGIVLLGLAMGGCGSGLAPVETLPTSYVAFVNESSAPVDQIVATDGERIYRIGSVTVEELLADIVGGDPIRSIYNYVSSAFSHKCSNGTPLPDEFAEEGILERLYSYSFGCCSDVNEPIMSSLYAGAGLTRPVSLFIQEI